MTYTETITNGLPEGWSIQQETPTIYGEFMLKKDGVWVANGYEYSTHGKSVWIITNVVAPETRSAIEKVMDNFRAHQQERLEMHYASIRDECKADAARRASAARKAILGEQP